MRVFVLANEGCGKGLLNRYRVIDLDSTISAGLSLITATAEGLTSCIDEIECPLEEGKFFSNRIRPIIFQYKPIEIPAVVLVHSHWRIKISMQFKISERI